MKKVYNLEASNAKILYMCILYMEFTGLNNQMEFKGLNNVSKSFILLINVKMPTIVGILTFMSRINFILS